MLDSDTLHILTVLTGVTL